MKHCKAQKQVTKSFLNENKHMKGWNPQKPTKLDGNDTTTLSRHPYILCHFANLHNAIKFVFIHYGIRPFEIRHSGNKSPQHTIQTQHCSCTPQFLHTSKTDHICHAQYSNYIVHCSHPQHNSLPLHTTCTTHPALPTQHYTPITTHHNAFCNPPPLHTTNKHKAYLCRWRQIGTRCRNGVTTSACRD